MPVGVGTLKVHDLGVRDSFKLLRTEVHEVRVESRPFAHGGCREAFYAYFKEKDGQWGPKMVAKRYLRSDAFLEDYVCAHMASECAQAFNALTPPKAVEYLVPNQILTLGEHNYSIEKFLEGHWEKHNNIFGMMESNRRTPNAFSHFSYVYSSHRYIILDVQGVGETYTDPAVVSVEQGRFGYTDTGLKGIKDFFKNHVCNEVCRAMKLPTFTENTIPNDVRWDALPTAVPSAPAPSTGFKSFTPQLLPRQLTAISVPVEERHKEERTPLGPALNHTVNHPRLLGPPSVPVQHRKPAQTHTPADRSDAPPTIVLPSGFGLPDRPRSPMVSPALPMQIAARPEKKIPRQSVNALQLVKAPPARAAPSTSATVGAPCTSLCPVGCGQRFTAEQMDAHVDECLTSHYLFQQNPAPPQRRRGGERGSRASATPTALCPAGCGQSFPVEVMDAHLDECLSLQTEDRWLRAGRRLSMFLF
eukprot:RCo052188